MFMVMLEGMMTLMSASSDMLRRCCRCRRWCGCPFSCELEGLDAVLAVAAGGDGEQDVAFEAEGFDLALEDVVVAVVVADGGEDAGVGGEGDGAKGGAVDGEAGDELGDEVLRVGGGASVAADHELAACFFMAAAVMRPASTTAAWMDSSARTLVMVSMDWASWRRTRSFMRYSVRQRVEGRT